MINESEKILLDYFRKKMPGIPAQVIQNTAQMMLANILPVYYPNLQAFARGEETDAAYGEFTLFNIMKGTGCDYVTALVLLSGYVKEPVKGKRNILFYR